MENLTIGTATMIYNEEGVNILASFQPEMKIDVSSDVLKNINGPDAQAIKSNADLVFASFFSKLNEIELADRNEFDIVSEVKECEKFLNGKVKKCVIQYIFKKL